MASVLALAVASMIALTGAAEGSPRKKRHPPSAERATPRQPVQDQDEFRFCDVAVREFIQGRREATALPVKEVKIDVLRMTLNFVHPYGDSGETAPNLGFTRAESVEERRKALNEAKRRINVLADAAKSGNVWYAVALRRDGADDSEPRRSQTSVAADDSRLTASAVVLASMDGKCTIVYEFKSIPVDRLSDELRGALGERGREASPSESLAKKPQS